MLLQKKHFNPNYTHAEFVFYLEQYNLKPGNQLDIQKYNEDTQGNRHFFILEEHHFDENNVNPYFVYYINSLGLKPGDGVITYMFSMWAKSKADEYKRTFTDNIFATIGNLPGGHEAFGEYLRSFTSKSTKPEQLTLFD